MPDLKIALERRVRCGAGRKTSVSGLSGNRALVSNSAMSQKAIYLSQKKLNVSCHYCHKTTASCLSDFACYIQVPAQCHRHQSRYLSRTVAGGSREECKYSGIPDVVPCWMLGGVCLWWFRWSGLPKCSKLVKGSHYGYAKVFLAGG